MMTIMTDYDSHQFYYRIENGTSLKVIFMNKNSSYEKDNCGYRRTKIF